VSQQLRDISLGTWLMIIGIAFSVAFQWRDFQNNGEIATELAKEVDANGNQLRDHTNNIAGLKERVAEIDARTSLLERDRNAYDRAMLERLSKIENALGRLEERMELLGPQQHR
jgi:hypothetical protein